MIASIFFITNVVLLCLDIFSIKINSNWMKQYLFVWIISLVNIDVYNILIDRRIFVIVPVSKLPIVINRSNTLIQMVTKKCDYDYSLNYHLVFSIETNWKIGLISIIRHVMHLCVNNANVNVTTTRSLCIYINRERLKGQGVFQVIKMRLYQLSRLYTLSL